MRILNNVVDTPSGNFVFEKSVACVAIHIPLKTWRHGSPGKPPIANVSNALEPFSSSKAKNHVPSLVAHPAGIVHLTRGGEVVQAFPIQE